jgi:hypothetical protein
MYVCRFHCPVLLGFHIDEIISVSQIDYPLTHSSPDLSRWHHLWADVIICKQTTSSVSRRHHLWADNIICEQTSSSVSRWHHLWTDDITCEQTTSSVSRCLSVSRWHHLHTFSSNLRCGWENIWTKVVHLNYVNNVSSNCWKLTVATLEVSKLKVERIEVGLTPDDMEVTREPSKKCQKRSTKMCTNDVLDMIRQKRGW